MVTTHLSLQILLTLGNVEDLREERWQSELGPIQAEPVQVSRVFRAQVPQLRQLNQQVGQHLWIARVIAAHLAKTQHHI